MSDQYYQTLYLRALQDVSTQAAARWSAESIACGLAFDYGTALGLLERYQWCADFCDDPACPECLHRPHEKHTSTCHVGLTLRGAP